MSAMNQNYNVYVSAIYCSFPRNNSTTLVSTNSSKFSIELQAMTSYESDVTVYTPRKNNSLESLIKSNANLPRTMRDRSPSKSFSFESSSQSLSRNVVSRLISEANIPFSLDRVQWQENPREGWISLKKQEDLFQCILDIVTRSQDDKFTLVLIIDKKTILPYHEYERMHYVRSVLEAARDASRMVSFMNQEQSRFGKPFSHSEWERAFDQPLREMGKKIGFNSYVSLIELALRLYAELEGCKLIPATKSSIQALEEVIFDDENESITSCPICLENMKMGSTVTCMPCSHRHKFHKPCILLWLEISYVCPLCRFELPTT